MTRLLTAVMLLAPGTALAKVPVTWTTTLGAARSQANRIDGPVLIGFEAPWCYSCYYMKKNVIDTKRFENFIRKKAGLLKVDVDTEYGRDLKQKYGVRFLPSYVVVDRKTQKEIGRVVGEQRADDFYVLLERVFASAQPSPARRLRDLVETGNWIEAKKEREFFVKAHDDLDKDVEWRIYSARLDLMIAKEEKIPVLGRGALRALLRDVKDCALAYDAFNALAFADAAPAVEREALLTLQLEALRDLVEKRVFGKPKERCADMRSPVDALAETAAKLGKPDLEKQALEGLLAVFEERLERVPLGDDRNLDDNYRWALERLDRHWKLDELYPKLVALHPYDYVYAYRYAKNLLRRDLPERAWDWSLRASGLSYGVNRLLVTRLQVDILDRLERWGEAEKLLERDIEANEGRFPDLVEALEKRLEEIRAKRVARGPAPEPPPAREPPAHPASLRGQSGGGPGSLNK